MRPFSSIVLFVSLLMIVQGNAESTWDLYGGYSKTQKSDVTVTRYYFYGGPDTYYDTVAGSSGMLGTRFVYWLNAEKNLWATSENGDDYQWLGFGADLFGFQLKDGNTDGYSVQFALDILFRYPHKTWQPYFGFGLLSHYSTIKVHNHPEIGSTVSGSDNGLGFDLRTGMLWKVTGTFSLFGELRYTTANFSEDKDDLILSGDTIGTDLDTVHYIMGISFPLNGTE